MIDLITGPFRSGKTAAVVSRIRKELDEGRFPLLAVPSRMQRDALSLRLSAVSGKGYAGKVICTCAPQSSDSMASDPPSVFTRWIRLAGPSPCACSSSSG